MEEQIEKQRSVLSILLVLIGCVFFVSSIIYANTVSISLTILPPVNSGTGTNTGPTTPTRPTTPTGPTTNTGTNSTGTNSTGTNSTGTNSTGTNSTGTNSTGTNSTGTNSTGTNSTGTNSTGTNSTGTNSSYHGIKVWTGIVINNRDTSDTGNNITTGNHNPYTTGGGAHETDYTLNNQTGGIINWINKKTTIKLSSNQTETPNTVGVSRPLTWADLHMEDLFNSNYDNNSGSSSLLNTGWESQIRTILAEYNIMILNSIVSLPVQKFLGTAIYPITGIKPRFPFLDLLFSPIANALNITRNGITFENIRISLFKFIPYPVVNASNINLLK